jgi:hypothetical protein
MRGKVNLARLNGPHGCVGSDVGAAPLVEHPGAVVRQLRVDFRHDAVAGLEQNEADLVAVHVLVKGRYSIHESGQLAEQLHPDQPAANDYERKHSALDLRVGFHVGALEALDDMVAEQQRVGQGLEREGVLRTGDHGAVGPGAEGQHQVVVSQLHVSSRGGQLHHPPVQVDAADGALAETRGPQECADGEGAMTRVQRPGKRLEQQRRHDQEVVPAIENDLDVRPAPQELLQATRRVDAAKAAAQDDDPSCPSGARTGMRHPRGVRGDPVAVHGRLPPARTQTASPIHVAPAGHTAAGGCGFGPTTFCHGSTGA